MSADSGFRSERKRSLWRRIVDFALTDVNTIVEGGIDDEAIERFERVLLEADFGVETTMELVAGLERASERGKIRSMSELRDHLSGEIAAILEGSGRPDGSGAAGEESSGTTLARGEDLGIVLVLGVNGVGKTTSVAKLAHRLQTAGDTVLLAAADTFRAGAQEQLRAWADRIGVGFVGGRRGGDPAAVTFDAVEAALSRRADWVLIDTAGRLHTQSDLMAELEKIDRVISRNVPGAPHERLLVVDATSGQNVLAQARQFGAVLELSGLVLAKFDSTGRGGTAVAVARELSVPVRFLGTGEALDDLEPFTAAGYVEKLLGAPGDV
ncbi:MAG: signal recognition particle-docking protein FtsY [Gemmatimonadota bacterium]|nr:signal recognition particle-docking protein FtsY [Gemmatimonadota bacterium]